MAQNIKSSDEPRIVDDSGSIFWEQYKGVILGGFIVVLIALGGFGLWWKQQNTRNSEAQALYAKARTVEAWQEVVAQYPKTPSAALSLIQLAAKAQAKQDFSGMLDQYDTFLKSFSKEPAAPAVQFSRAQVLQALGKTADAKTAYEDIINAKPEHPFFGGASVALARLYQAEKDTSRARQVLEGFTSRGQSSAYAKEASMLLAGLSAP